MFQKPCATTVRLSEFIGPFCDDARVSSLLGYARVSTADQNPDLQLDALNAAGCFRVFTDHASGALTDRPALAACLDHLRPGDTLVVWRLDRLGRSLPHLLSTVNDLATRDIGVRSLSEALDTTTATGRLTLAVFGALAQFERDLGRERTIAGLAAARARGSQPGRPKRLTADRLEVAQQLIDSGKPVTEVARTLGVGRSTLYRHLTPPA